MNIDDYPVGADTYDAPWNQEDPETKMLWANVTQTFFRQSPITVNNDMFESKDPTQYSGDLREFEELYKSQNFDPVDLLRKYRDLLIDIKQGKVPTFGKEIDFLISECNEWIVGCEGSVVEPEL